MEDRNYRVNIKDIYVGDVIGIEYPEDLQVEKHLKSRNFPVEGMQKKFVLVNDNRNYLIKAMKLDDESIDEYSLIDYCFGEAYYSGCYKFRRSMLFTLDENKHANDLLYTSPHYPIFNISPHDDCLKSEICIGRYTYEMYNLLKYFEYPNEIGYEDVLRIRNTFFSCDYVLDNCEIFGYKDGGTSIKKGHDSQANYDSKGIGRYIFDFKEDSPLSYMYFRMLCSNKDEYLFYKHSIRDKFKPCEEEGPIKSLGTIKKR